MKIIASWYGVINGEFTTNVDLYYNLKSYNIDVQFCLYLSEKSTMSNCIRHLNKNNNTDLLKCITTENVFEDDLIICTSHLPYEKEIKLKSKNLFILDSLNLKINDYQIPTLNSDNIVLFCNPSNINKKVSYKQIEYYHKFSEKRISNLPLYSKMILDKGNKELLIPKIFYYNRTKKPLIEISPGLYWENVGKRIFEVLYYGNTVKYVNEGLVEPDGLFYYLKLFDIDGYQSCNIKISEHIIKDKLFMKEDDKLLDLIRTI